MVGSIGRMTILKKILFTTLACVSFAATGNLWGDDVIQSSPAERAVQVDEQGVMRWRDTGEEVALFGVNYCVPSGYTYRAIRYVGASHEQAIDQDVAHFARMGFDAIRLCFWGDWQACDKEGNLVDNEHLRLLDYLIYRAKQRGIYMLLTPMILYSPQWPEPEEQNTSKGISKFYKKAQMSTDSAAIKAQQNYLYQLMNHVNRYTHVAYKDEPAILIVEMVNEPANPPTKEQTIEYINALAKAVRDTGCTKPLFYNASQTYWKPYMEALRDSSVEGVSFGWYPTGLVNGFSLEGNYLPLVDDYPQMHEPLLASKAKIVYEFDIPDVPGSYVYPAVARTFRSGGVQWATMFSYDPLALAYCNTEYQTSYVNLVYTPNKAVSLMISAEVFRWLPRGKSYGSYPENTHFGPFRVSYEQDLSEMVTELAMMYSNDTNIVPPEPHRLERIVGCGSSRVVKYEGMGCYFIEKLDKGLWRLEVYPDAVWVNDPYGKPRLDREVSRILWRKWSMRINLPDLGSDFAVEAVNEGNSCRTKAKDGMFSIMPGVYLLNRSGIGSKRWQASDPFGGLLLGEFIAPDQEDKPTVVVHEPYPEVVAGRKLCIGARVVSTDVPKRVTLYMRRTGWGSFLAYQMQRQKNYQYTVELPAKQVKGGMLEYAITVESNDETRTFPANITGEPSDWDFPVVRLWETLVVEKSAPVVLFDVKRDRDRLLFPDKWHSVKYSKDFVPGQTIGALAVRLDVPNFKAEPHDVSVRYLFAHELEARRAELSWFDIVKVRARAVHETTTHVEIALLEHDRSAWTTKVLLSTDWQDIRIPLTKLRLGEVAVMPRDFPRIFPYWEKSPAARGGDGDRLNTQELAGLQISLGKRLFGNEGDGPHGVEIESIVLEKPNPRE